jgi:hypothetical protein
MRMMLKIGLLICSFLMIRQPAFCQQQELQQLILNIEKLAQFKQILAEMKKGYEILSAGYNTVKDVSEGNFSLHKAFLNGLLKVSPTVKKYYKVADIIRYQLLILKQCTRGKRAFNVSDQLKAYSEHGHMVYDRIISQSLDGLNDLLKVLTDGTYRMSDEERLREVDNIYENMKDQLAFLQYFNSSNGIFELQESKERRDIKALGKYYDVK